MCNPFVEDFTTWDTQQLVEVPPETLEAADLMALVIELQNRVVLYREYMWMYNELAK